MKSGHADCARRQVMTRAAIALTLVCAGCSDPAVVNASVRDAGDRAADTSGAPVDAMQDGRGPNGTKPTPVSCTAPATTDIASAITMATVSTTETACGELAGTAAEIAATPRADTNLEKLARATSGGFTAETTLYNRLVRDIYAIRGCYSAVANVHYFDAEDQQGLYLEIDHDTFTLIGSGEYRAWDCLNEWFAIDPGKPSWFSSSNRGMVVLTTRGILDLSRIVDEYKKLPGVTAAGRDVAAGDASTICVRDRSGSFEYLFAQQAGDCPAGCIEHDSYWFRVTTDGVVTLLGAWGTNLGDDPSVPDDARAWAASCHRN
jgi:hypothetical protein